MRTLSLILPAYRSADHLGSVVPELIDALDRVPVAPEVLVVLNGPDDGGAAVAETLHARDRRIRVLRCEQAGWGRAVRTGLAAASGELVAYTNLARTSPELLHAVVHRALDEPGALVKARRRDRDRLARRVGSTLYNLECRLLLGTSTRDVNGTPKVLPAACTELRAVQHDDDLLDAEVVATCEASGFPVVEVAAPVLYRRSGSSTTGLRSAWHLYLGVPGLRRELRRRGRSEHAGKRS